MSRLALTLSVALAAFSVLGNIAVLRALDTLHPALTSVATNTQVFFIVALAWPLLGERPTARFAIGVMIALCGFALMQVPIAGDVDISLPGMLWGLLAATMWGSMQVTTRRFVNQVEPVAVNAARLWLAAGALACFPDARAGLAAAPARAWIYAGAAAFLGPFVSRVCLMYALRGTTASRVALIGLFGPVVAFISGYLAFGTAPHTLELVGGAIIILGVALPLSEND